MNFSEPLAQKRTELTALDKLGIESLASSMGVSPDSVLLVTAAMLTAAAGPDTWLRTTVGNEPLPKLNLLARAECHRLKRLIQHLSSPLSMMNRRLIETSRRHNPEAIQFLVTGTTKKSSESKRADFLDPSSDLMRHRLALRGPSENQDDCLLSDLAFDPVVARAESLLHPQFLVINAEGAGLRELVEECHSRHALVIEPLLGLTRNCSEPAKLIRQIGALMDGIAPGTRSTSNKEVRLVGTNVQARMVLRLRVQEIRVLLDPVFGMGQRFLWLEDSRTANAGSDDPDANARFGSAYQRAIGEVVGLRRAGRQPLFEFASSSDLAHFTSEQRAYEAEFDGLGFDPGASVRGLPMCLAWALGFLRRQLARENRFSDRSLIHAAFASARRLGKIHVVEVRKLTHAKMLEDQLHTAGRIVKLLVGGPRKLREIVRRFNDQKKERFLPVLEALIEVGVLSVSDDGEYSCGEFEIADVKDELVARLTILVAGQVP